MKRSLDCFNSYRKPREFGPVTAIRVQLPARASRTGSGDLSQSEYQKARSMNTALGNVIPMVEAKVAKGNLLEEKPQELDPCESLPWLPCMLVLELPVVKFTVGDLLSLSKGTVVETAYHQSSDLPLRVNGQLVGWTEFEVVGEQLAVRLTDLS